MASTASSLTRFPSLYSDVDLEIHRKHGSHQIYLGDKALQEETVVIGWAALLRAYTGKETSVFAVDERVVSVGSAEAKVEEVSIDHYSNRGTAIRFCNTAPQTVDAKSSIPNSESSDSELNGLSSVDRSEQRPVSNSSAQSYASSPALILYCDLTSSSFRLETFGLVPIEHLEEIGRQLHTIIEQFLRLGENYETFEQTPLKMSAINTSPKRGKGPELLHDLAFHHRLFDNVAIDCKNADGTRTSYSYHQLRSRSLRFAAKLRRCFNNTSASRYKSNVVPVLVPQSVNLYVALLAILEIGAAFCPINMDSPSDRIDFILKDVDAKVIVTTKADLPRLKSAPLTQPCVVDEIMSDEGDGYNQESNDWKQVHSNLMRPSPEKWAYIMYTSGSTGQPKGVPLSHSAVTQSLLAHDPHIPPYFRFLQFASPTFDVSMFEIFFTFFRGSTLVGASRKELLNDLPGIINELDIDAAELTPTVAGTLIRSRQEVPNLRVLLTIGEMLTREVVREFGASQAQTPMLHGMYGPTEAAIHCTLEPNFSSSAKNGIIGIPLDTVSAFIAKPVDSNSTSTKVEIVALGQIGELVVGGHQLADGYLNREEKTNAVFVEDEVHGMLYRTGDKARMLPDGNLECLGRIEAGQVKLRGQRIELGEIEQAAMQTNGCRLAVAFVIHDNLVLFCLADSDNIQPDHIIQTCKAWLLPYMLPSEVILRRGFPQLPSGKIDKKTLEASYHSEDRSDRDDLDDVEDNELINEICEVTQTVLQCVINPGSELSKVGLDSLKAIRLVSELRKRGIETTALDVLKHSSVRLLYEALSKTQAPAEPSILGETIKIVRTKAANVPELKGWNAHISEILPCTPLQASMLAETFKDPQAYCNWFELEFDQGFSEWEISKAFDQLFESNTIMRSGFAAIDDSTIGFAQIVWKERDESQICYASADVSKKFSLNETQNFLRPLRVLIHKIDSNVRAVIQLHHALYDGWSLDLLIEDLNTALQGGILPERPTFRHMVEYLLSVSDSSSSDESRDYWENKLADCQPAPFPDFSHHKPADAARSSLSTVSFELQLNPEDLTSRHTFHPQIYFECALSYLWAAYVGSTEVILGCVASGRTLPIRDIENIVGPCISTLPLRVALEGSDTVGDLLQSISEDNRKMAEHCIIPLQDIKKLAKVEPGRSLFDVVFIWQETMMSGDKTSKLAKQVDSADILETPLLIEVEPRQGSLLVKATQRGEGLPDFQVRCLIEQMADIVKSLAEKTQEALSVFTTSRMNELVSERLLSMSPRSHRATNHEALNSESEINDHFNRFACILANDLRTPDSMALPIGAIGTLAFQQDQSIRDGKTNVAGLEILENSNYGPLCPTNVMCRMSFEGQIQVFGDIRDIARFRKHMLNLKSVSKFIFESPGVEDCVTLVNQHGSKPTLVAFWTPAPSINARKQHNTDQLIGAIEPPTRKALLAVVNEIVERFEASGMPSYLIPAVFVPYGASNLSDTDESTLLNVLASTVSQGHLEDFGYHQRTKSEEFEGDKLGIERQIADALAETLEISQADFGRSTSFFRLGLDSISAIVFARRLNKLLRYAEIDVPFILRHPTVGRLASNLSQLSGSGTPKGEEKVDFLLESDLLASLSGSFARKGLLVDSIRPCTSLQEGMLASSSKAAYYNHTVFELYDDPSRFMEVFRQMCKRHDILRTCFISTEDSQFPFVQAVLKDFEIPYEAIRTTTKAFDATLERLMTKDLTALDTMRAPLSMTVVNVAQSRILLLSMHHALYDGEAISYLLKEVEMVLNGQALPFTPSFEEFLQKSLPTEFSKADKFWDKLLESFRPLPLPKLSGAGNISPFEPTDSETSIFSEILPVKLSEIEHVAQSSSATIQAVLQAAWAKVISTILNTTDVCFGNVVSGRTLSIDGLDRLVAPCFNTIPVRVHLKSNFSNEDIIKNLQDLNSKSLEFQFTPLRRIQSRLDLNGIGLFDTLFILQREQPALEKNLWTKKGEFGDMGFPVVCELVPNSKSDQVTLSLYLKRTFITKEHIQHLADVFKASLTACVRKPETRVQDFKSHELKALLTSKRTNGGNLYEADKSEFESEYFDFEEDAVARTVRETLSRFAKVQVELISPTSSIYQLGLDSISAIQVGKILRSEGYQVSAEHIMEQRTVGAITNFVRKNSNNSKTLDFQFDFVKFDAANRSQICRSHNVDESQVTAVQPCTQSQAGMVSQSLTHEGKTYINHFVFELHPDIDVERLRDSWKTAAQHHEILRTGFSICSDPKYSFAMIQYSASSIEIPWEELSENANGFADAPLYTLAQIRDKIARQIIQNLERPAWHVCLVRDKKEGKTYTQFSAHHALYDAESLRLILADVARAYQSESLLAERSTQPLLRAILSGEEGNNDHKDFWRNILQDFTVNKFPDLSPLRVDCRHIQTAALDVSNLEELRHGCQKLDISLQAALQVAWARLLSAYLGEEDVTFGVVLAGRDSDGAEEILFPSTTTIPYRCIVTEDIGGMLQDAMRYNTSARKHQHTPLTQMKRLAGCSTGTLFDTLLVLQAAEKEGPEHELWHTVDEEATVEYPLSIEATIKSNETLTISAVFWDDFLPVAQARLLLSQIASSLQSTILGGIDFPVDVLSKLEPKEPQLPSSVKILHGFVEETAKTRPNHIALEFVEDIDDERSVRKWTYRELEEDGNKIANLVIDRGALPRSLVAVCFEKSPEASISMLGILKAGCGFIALDPTAPSARKAFMLEDSQTTMVLTLSRLAQDMDLESNIQVICVDSLDLGGMNPKKPTTSDQVDPGDVSYCLYTSGSTGIPKGCLLSHENAVQAMLAFQRLFSGRWDDASRWLQFASFHFDVSVLEQFWSWSVGICVVSTPRDVLFADLPRALNKLGITHIDLTPSLARLITPDQVPSLCNGIFITGGEPLKQEVLNSWGAIGNIHNGYGPTEATIGCTMYTQVPENGKPSNIGWQFDNVGTYVFVPGTTRLVPRGAIGELCVSGKLVGLGYLNREDLTKESFPFIEEYGETIYRTKDLVRMLHDGTFEFLGRCDDQVKLRGQRLELGEINNAIKGRIEVAQEVLTIVTKRSESQSEQLVSFVAVGQDAFSSSDQKRSEIKKMAVEACQAKLPSYMVPSHVILLESIPLTNNNKSDMKKLKEIFERSVKGQTRNKDALEVENPELQRTLIRVLGDFLSMPAQSISLSSNVFELGLDSISVFGFSRTLQNEGISNAQPNLLMQNHILNDLANALGQSQALEHREIETRHEITAFQKKYQAKAARSLGVNINEVENIFPCTPLQQGMLIRSLENDQRPYFNTFTFESYVNDTILWNAVEDLTAAIPILRTVFVSVEGLYVQAVMRKKSVLKAWHISEESSCDKLDEAICHLRYEWLRENEEKYRMPFQVIMLKCGGKSYLLFNIFHALYDGTSLSLLFQGLAMRVRSQGSATCGLSFHEALHLGPLKKVDGAEQFWKGKLRGASAYQISPESTEPRRASTATKQMHTADRFENVRRQMAVTHQALVQAAWTSVLYEFLQTCAILGMVVSGRSMALEDAENIIGPMFNTIPVFVDILSDDTWRSLARKCHDLNVAALPYQHTALRDIQKWCKTTNQEKLFDNLFVFQKQFGDSAVETSDLWKELYSNTDADYPLAFEAEQTAAGTLNITIVAHSHIADESACRSLLEKFEEHFELLLSAPDSSVSDAVALHNISTEKNVLIGPKERDKQEAVESGSFEWTAEAEALRKIIAELSRVDENSISGYTSIFQLGLDSIDAIKISSAMKRKQFQLSVSSITRNPTITGMLHVMVDSSGHYQSQQSSAEALKKSLWEYFSANGFDNSNFEDIIPATPLQEALVAGMFSSGFENYFNHDVLQLGPDVDISTLKAAIETVLANSAILRTSFSEVDSVAIGCSFAQLVHKEYVPTFESFELSSSFTMDNVIDLLKEQTRAAYANDSSQNLIPLKFSFVKDGNSTFLVLSISHALYDGWSISLIHNDIVSAYHGKSLPRPSYSEVLDMILDGDNDDAQNYWHDYICSTSGCEFPTHEVKNGQSHKINFKERPSKLDLSTIQAFCRDHGVGMQALGQLCWSYVLATYTRNLDITFGVVLSGREDEEAQRVMFPTMNTVVARAIISGSRVEMLKNMQANLADILQYQHYPLRRVQAMAGVAAGRYLFDTLFIYQKRPLESEKANPLYQSVDGASSVDYPVCVEMEVVGDIFTWRTACKETALSEDGVEELLSRLDATLESVIQDPNKPSIEFMNKEASVCGLSAFSIHDLDAPSKPLQRQEEMMGSLSEGSKEVEKVLREVLSAVSGIPDQEIRGSDTVFHLGVDSISLIKVSSLMRKRSLPISVSEMMKAGTVTGIARSINKAQSDPSRARGFKHNPDEIIGRVLNSINIQELIRNHGFDPTNIESILPATAAQVYFLTQWQISQGALFAPSFDYKFLGSVDISRIRHEWNELVKSCWILRTTFLSTGNQQVPFVQVILDKPANSFFEHATSERSLTGEWDFMEPPVRAYVKNSTSGDVHLSIHIHHALYDAVSLPLIIQRLEHFCNGESMRVNDQNQETFKQFLSICVSPDTREERRKFWVTYLSEAKAFPLTDLPTAKQVKNPTRRTEFYKPRALQIPKSGNKTLRSHGVSINSLFLATFAAVYANMLSSRQANSGNKDKLVSSSRDVIFGLYLANRSSDLGCTSQGEEETLSALPAPTLNLLPLVVKSPLESSLYESAKQIQVDLQKISSSENAGVGLWEIEQWTGIKIDCFVNFLRLPGNDEAEDTDNLSGQADGVDRTTSSSNIEIRPLSIQDYTKPDFIKDAKASPAKRDQTHGSRTPKAIENNAVVDSYLPSWDVEAAMRDGALDIGIFGPSEVVGSSEAEEIIEDIVLKLETVLQP